MSIGKKIGKVKNRIVLLSFIKLSKYIQAKWLATYFQYNLEYFFRFRMPQVKLAIMFQKTKTFTLQFALYLRSYCRHCCVYFVKY